MPVVHRRAPHRRQMRTDAPPGQGADRHRRIGRAEGGGADALDVQPALAGHDGQRIEVGRLALVGTHAQRGVTLEVLDRHITLEVRQFDIVHRHVTLEVDKGLVHRFARNDRGHRYKRHATRIGRRCGGTHARQVLATGRCRGCRRRPAALHRAIQALGTQHAAGAEMPAVEAARHETRQPRFVDRFDAAVRTQMHGRCPAAGHRDQVDLHDFADAGDTPAADIEGRNRALPNPVRTTRLRHRAGLPHVHAGRARLCQQPRAHLAARIRQNDLGASAGQRHGIGVRGIVVGGKHGMAARHHRITVDVRPDRGRQHDAGTVVAGKHQRPLDGAAGHDDVGGAHHVQPLARHTTRCIGQAGCTALDDADRVAVVQPERGRAQQQPHSAGIRQVLQHARQPLGSLTAHRMRQQRATGLEILLHQRHIQAGARRTERRGQSGRAGTHDQHVGEPMVPVVPVRIGRL